MIKLLISEEYGYQYWYAALTEEEYQALLARWATMRGLYCSVPVTLIVPQAKPLWITLEGDFMCSNQKMDLDGKEVLHCHIHEHRDSHLDGSDYIIPDADDFWIDGKRYTYPELCDLYPVDQLDDGK